jgi:hypothetical protein
MIRTLVTLAAGIGLGVAGVTATQHEGVKVTTLAARDIVEKLDGKEAKATFQEVTLEAGQADVPHRLYHLVDDDPSPVSRWLPAFARWVGAPPPPRVTEQEGRERGGEDAVYYGTKLRGATNGKAKETLNFTPRRLQWLDQ